jgi:soluble lytic murein transglycosylase
LSPQEAAEKLRTGNIAFILEKTPPEMAELANLSPEAPFYAGILVKNQAGEKAEALKDALFEAALDGGGPVRKAAAEELTVSLLDREAAVAAALLERLEKKTRTFQDSSPVLTLRAAALYRTGRFDDLNRLYQGFTQARPGPWDRAFACLGSLKAGAEIPEGMETLGDFFLSLPLGDAQRWANGELGTETAWLSPAEYTALQGRFAAARSSYGEALEHFQDIWKQDERLFFRYGSLLGDLGRTFQFSGFRETGAELLLDQERRIQGGALNDEDFDIPGIRYMLLYYAARIYRQVQQYARATALFARALDFAPDPLQEDACIWYMLNISLTLDPEETPALVKAYLPRWHSDAYFADILDRLARYLVVNRRWNTMEEIYSLIRNRSDGASAAKYAYILGRAVSEGLVSEAGFTAASTTEEYFKAAFEKGDVSFYYRALGAFRLGKNTVPVPGPGSPAVSPGEEMAFLLNFFQYGAGVYSLSYFNTDEPDRFSAAELRLLAQALADTGLWAESMRVVSSYINREGYVIDRRDMELFYPRPYNDLIETYARENGIPMEIFFGLVRTESAFVPANRSWAGAIGLTQLMPATALEMAGRLSRRGGPDYIKDGEIDLENPETNLHLGAVYLAYLMDRMENPMLALLAYNGGMGRLRRWRNMEQSLPPDIFLETIEYPETRDYGRKVLAAAAAYGYLYYNLSMEAVLADIFKQ